MVYFGKIHYFASSDRGNFQNYFLEGLFEINIHEWLKYEKVINILNNNSASFIKIDRYDGCDVAYLHFIKR